MRFINEKLRQFVLIFKSNLPLIGGLFLAAFLNFFLIGNRALFLDEAASYLITQDFPSMLYIFWHFEGNMWFYYLLLHFWSYLGTSEALLRSLSAIFAVLSIIPTYFLAKELFDKRVASIAMIILPINLLFIKNAQFARGYSLVILLTTITTLFFVRYLNKQTHSKVIVYILASVLAVYTHLFAVFVIGSHLIYLILLKKKMVLKFLKTYFLIGLASMPPFLAPSMQSGQIDWIQKPILNDLLAAIVFLTGDFLPIVFLYSIVVLWYVLSKKYKVDNIKINFIILLVAFPIIFVFIFSFAVKPIFNLQYLSICLIPLTIFLSKILAALHSKLLQYALLIILILSVIRIDSWYQNSSYYNGFVTNQNSDWKNSVNYITNKAKKTDIIIISPTYSEITFNYYRNRIRPNVEYAILPIQRINFYTLKPSIYDYDSLKTLPKINSTVWLLQETGIFSNTETKEKVAEALKKYKQRESSSFTKITITRYEN